MLVFPIACFHTVSSGLDVAMCNSISYKKWETIDQVTRRLSAVPLQPWCTSLDNRSKQRYVAVCVSDPQLCLKSPDNRSNRSASRAVCVVLTCPTVFSLQLTVECCFACSMSPVWSEHGPSRSANRRGPDFDFWSLNRSCQLLKIARLEIVRVKGSLERTTNAHLFISYGSDRVMEARGSYDV